MLNGYQKVIAGKWFRRSILLMLIVSVLVTAVEGHQLYSNRSYLNQVFESKDELEKAYLSSETFDSMVKNSLSAYISYSEINNLFGWDDEEPV